MKRIELTIPDEASPQVLAALAGFPLNTLAVMTVDEDQQLVTMIADYVQAEGVRLQGTGRKNSALTGREIATGIRSHAFEEPASRLPFATVEGLLLEGNNKGGGLFVGGGGAGGAGIAPDTEPGK